MSRSRQALIRSCCRLQDLKRCFERISNRFAIGLAAVLLLNFTACQSLRMAAAPVVVYDARVCSQEAGGLAPEGFGLGVEFVAVNLCGRPIQSVSFRICAAEREDGGGADGSGDYGVAAEGAFYEAFWTLEDGLDVGEERTVFVPLEDAPPDCDADDLEVDGVYVENAIFCD